MLNKIPNYLVFSKIMPISCSGKIEFHGLQCCSWEPTTNFKTINPEFSPICFMIKCCLFWADKSVFRTTLNDQGEISLSLEKAQQFHQFKKCWTNNDFEQIWNNSWKSVNHSFRIHCWIPLARWFCDFPLNSYWPGTCKTSVPRCCGIP